MNAPTYERCPCGGAVHEVAGYPTCDECGNEASAWNANTGTVSRWVTRRKAEQGRQALRDMIADADGAQWDRWGWDY